MKYCRCPSQKLHPSKKHGWAYRLEEALDRPFSVRSKSLWLKEWLLGGGEAPVSTSRQLIERNSRIGAERIAASDDSSCKIVAMMQAAKSWHGNDDRDHSRIHFCFATRGRLLAQTEVRPVAVVIADILGHEPFQMALIEHDQVVKQITAAGADEALRDSVLPRALKAGSLGFDTETS